MSDAEKPTPDDLAPASVHRQRWEDAKTTEEALRRNLFAARDALITEGVARNAAEARVKELLVLLDRARDSLRQHDVDYHHVTPAALRSDIDEALK